MPIVPLYLEKVKAALDGAGIEMPFPQVKVHLEGAVPAPVEGYGREPNDER